MIKLTYQNNVRRDPPRMVSQDSTIRAALDEIGCDFSKGITSLNGGALSEADLDKTFADFGVTETAFITNVAKAVNA